MCFIGKRLTELREKKKLSKVGLVQRLFKEVDLEIDPTTIRYWEQGKNVNPSYTSMKKLAKFFGKKIEYFFD